MTSWIAVLPCSRGVGEATAAIDLDRMAWCEEPVVVASEIDARTPNAWQITAYFAARPSAADLRLFSRLAESSQRATAVKLPDEDWVTMSQAGLEPIRAGRFHVHTSATPPDTAAHNLCIEAGLAFGTGHHETTHGCLEMLDRIRRSGHMPRRVLDLGTGTGLLAFAAAHLWPTARVTASDIDPVCADVVAVNASVNGIAVGRGHGQVRMVVADGMDDRQLQRRGPYNVIAANILARPLIEMAPDIAAALAPRGQLILAGLLNGQARSVLRAYRRQRLFPVQRRVRGDWTILRLRKRRRVA